VLDQQVARTFPTGPYVVTDRFEDLPTGHHGLIYGDPAWRFKTRDNATAVPVIGSGAKERVDAIALRNWLTTYKPQQAYIERAQAMPGQGASSGFKYGRATGAIEAVLACCEIPVTVIEPNAWKRFHRLHGRDKEGGRQRALQLFPAAHAMLARRKDHGRGEASSIALYGAQA
jgi:crossover junction endodeoxyribonuclease RuvC